MMVDNFGIFVIILLVVIKMSKEKWMPIGELKGFYEVSNTGLVRRLPRHDGWKNLKSKILKSYINKRGYLAVDITFKYKRYRYQVHNLVLESFVSRRPKNKVCNHKNGLKLDNNVNNLEWVTVSENIKHAFDTGLNKISDKCKEKTSQRSRKLTWEQSLEIKDKYKNGYTQRRLAEEYNISLCSIQNILSGKTFRVKSYV